ncbi:hypothetical protein [Schlesneria sp.]|uniref:hypothetical protein n=1 Tax=Schlesneria sp. TaxID=2762018 RepID=UPI002EEAD519
MDSLTLSQAMAYADQLLARLEDGFHVEKSEVKRLEFAVENYSRGSEVGRMLMDRFDLIVIKTGYED